MQEESYIKRIFGNSAWIIASKIINIIVGIVVSICVTRYLGAEQKGAMAISSSIAGFWGFVASFGLLDIMISKFSKERDNSGIIAATGMTLMFGGGTVAFLLALISAIVLDVDFDIFIYVAISAFVYFFQYLSVYEYWFYSNTNSKYFAVIQVGVHLLFLLIRVVGVPFEMGLVYFIICTAIETVVIYLSLIICYHIAKCEFIGPFSFDKVVAKDLFFQAVPMIIMGFATTIYMKVDQIMVGKLIGNIELGYYSVAINLAEYWYFIPITIYSSFLPTLTKCFVDKDIFMRRLQQFADIQMLIGYLAVFMVMILGHWGTVLLYGEEFEKSAFILMVYIWSGIFTCLSFSGQAVYIINKDTKTVMWINLVGAALNFVFNMIFIFIMGSIGAALATLVEFLLIAFGQMLLLRRKYGDLYRIQLKSFIPFFRIGKQLIKLKT